MSASRRTLLGAGALIAAAVAAAYSNTFGVPFIFDDLDAILKNRTIQPGWTLAGILHGQVGTSALGRPLLNLSLALNQSISGVQVWSYHALNLLIHLAAALVLLGLVRRTLGRIGWGNETGLALAVALLWALHPLQTESVTYVIQRAESLMGLCYLLTLYAFVRATERTAPGTAGECRLWLGLSWLACLLGMATKEVMVTAPIMALMYDRAFVAGSFGKAWRERRGYYCALAATWLLLFVLFLQTGGNRGGTIGFGVSIPWWKYALTQFQAIAHYLWLSVWPHPLILDYGAAWARGPADVLPYVPVVAALVGGTLYALWRHPRAGFLGCWFLAILAPTSSVIPGIRQTLAEHRMYLPLAAVLVAFVLAGERLAQRLAPRRNGLLAGTAGLLVCIAAGAGTLRRNHDYRSALAIWSDTVAKRPGNPDARFDLAFALADAGRPDEALAEDEAAVRLNPGLPEGHNVLGAALAAGGRLPEALAEYERALRGEPDNPYFEFDLANGLAQAGQLAAAIAHFQRVLGLKPDFPEACLNLGNALLRSGQPEAAARQYRAALRLRPDYADAQANLSIVLRAQAPNGAAP
jgi:tetratricopeptide (TPR) repeat protein